MSLTRDQILGALDQKLVEVPAPEWGGSVFVRPMTGFERDRFEAAVSRSTAGARARLCASCLCDESGKLLFTEADLEAINEKSGTVLDRVSDAAMRVCGIGVKDVDAAAKNSEAVTSGSTPTGSPASAG